MGKIHIGPPPPKSLTDWQTNTSENITFAHYVADGKNKHVQRCLGTTESQHFVHTSIYTYLLFCPGNFLHNGIKYIRISSSSLSVIIVYIGNYKDETKFHYRLSEKYIQLRSYCIKELYCAHKK